MQTDFSNSVTQHTAPDGTAIPAFPYGSLLPGTTGATYLSVFLEPGPNPTAEGVTSITVELSTTDDFAEIVASRTKEVGVDYEGMDEKGLEFELVGLEPDTFYRARAVANVTP